jgi:hypothetical protein
LNGTHDSRDFCHYLEKSLYIGRMEGGTILTEISQNVFVPLEKVSISDQIKKINTFHEAQEVVRNCRIQVNDHLKGLIR